MPRTPQRCWILWEQGSHPLSIPAMRGVHSKGMQPLQKHSWLEEHLPSKQKQRETCSLIFCLTSQAVRSSQCHACWNLLSSAESCPYCAPSAATAKGRALQDTVCLSHHSQSSLCALSHPSQSRGGVSKQRIKAEWVEGSETWATPCWPLGKSHSVLCWGSALCAQSK